MKRYITPQEVHDKSYLLGANVMASGFKPDYMVAIWRGGAPVGCYVHEMFKYLGCHSDHIAIRTSRYKGVDKARSSVQVHNLGYLMERLNKDSKLLLVDDIFDTGLSIKAVINTLKEKLGDNFPSQIRIATLFCKPARNKTDIIPDYCIEAVDSWIIFAHELEEQSLEEIEEFHGKDVSNIIKKLSK